MQHFGDVIKKGIITIFIGNDEQNQLAYYKIFQYL